MPSPTHAHPLQFFGGPKFLLLQGIRGLTLLSFFEDCFFKLAVELGGLARFFIEDEGRSRGLTLLLRDDEREDSGLVFRTFFELLELLGDGFNKVACNIMNYSNSFFSLF